MEEVLEGRGPLDGVIEVIIKDIYTSSYSRLLLYAHQPHQFRPISDLSPVLLLDLKAVIGCLQTILLSKEE